jgi:uncharacterized protein (TIGR02996 family)
MSLEEAFLQAIRESPDDNAPRLIFADWLEEHGNPERAEFIRVQCALATLPPAAPGRPALQRRQQELLREHAKVWLGSLPRLVHRCTFRRGFVEKVSVEAAVFLTRADTLFRLAPLRGVRLTAVARHVASLAASPYLARLASLSLDGVGLGPHEARALAASPFLGGLRTLDLHNNRLAPAGVEALAACPGLSGLTSLYVRCCQLGQVGARALAESRHLTNLTALDLRGNGIPAEGLRALAAAAHLSRLKALWLGSNGVNDRLVRDLAEPPCRSSLVVLDLTSSTLLTDVGAFALARSPSLGGLKELALWPAARISPNGREALRRRFGTHVSLETPSGGARPAYWRAYDGV